MEFPTSSPSRLGCQELFYGISTIDSEASIVKLPLAVCEFSDVFPKDLSGLLPTRAIEFSIDFVLDTLPISIPPYHIAPTELKELKVQLEELLHKGFICPSASL